MQWIIECNTHQWEKSAACLLTRHGECDKPKSWSHQSCHLLTSPSSTLTSTDRQRSRLYRSIFPVHFTTVPAIKTNKSEYATMRYPGLLCAQIVEIHACLTPEELFGSLSVIISHKHERNDKSYGIFFSARELTHALSADCALLLRARKTWHPRAQSSHELMRKQGFYNSPRAYY